MTDPQHGEAQAFPAIPGLAIIHALGRRCPVPVIMLAERIAQVRAGQLVEVLADDPATKTDLPAWCTFTSHELIRIEDRPAGWSFLVRRSP